MYVMSSPSNIRLDTPGIGFSPAEYISVISVKSEYSNEFFNPSKLSLVLVNLWGWNITINFPEVFSLRAFVVALISVGWWP